MTRSFVVIPLVGTLFLAGCAGTGPKDPSGFTVPTLPNIGPLIDPTIAALPLSVQPVAIATRDAIFTGCGWEEKGFNVAQIIATFAFPAATPVLTIANKVAGAFCRSVTAKGGIRRGGKPRMFRGVVLHGRFAR